MALNPVQFAEHVNEQFLRYQLTAFPLSDPDLFAQAKEMLHGRLSSPLFKGPYVSLSRAFRFGPTLQELADQGTIHPALAGIAPYPTLFAHQWEALKAVKADKHCLISTGTGSGKTEAFLYPIIDHCLRLRDEGAPEGIAAILVYPMNALAIDQLGRLRELLAGTGITFGMYVGSTPSRAEEAADYVRLEKGQGRQAYLKRLAQVKDQTKEIISPWEERVTEEEMREAPPRILLTNVNQLELLMTRGRDLDMFRNAPLRFMVFDEAHTYSGIKGAETACLIRRVRAFCRKSSDEVICIGTSATLTDPASGEAAGPRFANRFFGIAPERVALVKEQYQEQQWPLDRYQPRLPKADLPALLSNLLAAIEHDEAETLADLFAALTGQALPAGGDIHARLYEALQRNEVAYQIDNLLPQPRILREVAEILARRLNREHHHQEQAEAEIMCYLALGAAARREENPLMRPKLHYFVRGMEGAAAVFELDEQGQPYPKIFYSAADALEAEVTRQPTAVFPILVCQTCGQHFFRTTVQDLSFEGVEARGGDAIEGGAVWPPIPMDPNVSLTFTNRYIGELFDSEDEDADAERVRERLDRRRVHLYFCRFCGAMHKQSSEQCANEACRREEPLVPVYALSTLGPVERCPTCGEKARGFSDRRNEPIRRMKAAATAEVHILAQDMLGAAEPQHQKLICFADNRQDAAFQAGWMRDHARRYRLRHLVHNLICEAAEPISIGDLQEKLLKLFSADRDLARSLAPEVFEGLTEEAFGRAIKTNLAKYARIALVSELATSFKQRDSLETWGVIRIVYAGLSCEDPDIVRWANTYGWQPQTVVDGLCTLVDVYRRTRHFHDPTEPIFSRWWREGDEEIQRSYLPFWDFPPKGLKLRREGEPDKHATQLVSDKGRTLTHDFVAKWWPDDERPDASTIRSFIEELWTKLTAEQVLRQVTMVGGKGGTLAGHQGVHQVAADRLGLVTQKERYRCNVCQRVHTRPTPRLSCTTMHCRGTLTHETPPDHDYNVALLAQPFSMLVAEEHTAQVPAAQRAAIERQFKDVSGRINCLVATPTLELGVNIGALDMVLMRNVPPQASNYWQRAGRAGREHRMAVIYTYCRRTLHDEYFFEDPQRILGGEIRPPQFNLRNDIMLRKHVHATALSELIAMSRSDTGELTPHDQQEVRETLALVLPRFVGDYLFMDGRDYRHAAYDVLALHTVVTKHAERLLATVQRVFAAHWPEEAVAETSTEAVVKLLQGMTEELQAVAHLLHKRLAWAMATQRKLGDRRVVGLLDEFEMRLEKRCDEYIRGLAADDKRNYTLSVLANEGFLPGYGSYGEGVVAFGQRDWGARARESAFQLPRAAALAVREFIPGNLIYANASRFRLAMYHFPVGEEQATVENYVVNTDSGAIRTASTTADGYSSDGEVSLEGVPICDCDLAFISRISDAETNRFQLPVRLLAYLKPGHNGGGVYTVAHKELRHMLGQQFRLVNVGPVDRVNAGRLGYPICSVCGAARSPYASDEDLAKFRAKHLQTCGRAPGNMALSADARVDGFVIDGLGTRAAAVNLAEALRIGAGQVMEMETRDLDYVSMARNGSFDLFLYDPMPGGSGLLNQIMERWDEVIVAATAALQQCPTACETSCYECMRTYYNMSFHRDLDRHQALSLLAEFASPPVISYQLAPTPDIQAPAGTSQQSNADRLLQMLRRAGFPEPDREQSIHIGQPFEWTVPDFSYYNEIDDVLVAIYLDGLSKGIHGNPQRQAQDRAIRLQLETQGWDVIEIANSDLDDVVALRAALARLAKALDDRELRDKVRNDTDWFG
jgi:ATP-dependent helicase YprA (DUF1998 family)